MGKKHIFGSSWLGLKGKLGLEVTDPSLEVTDPSLEAGGGYREISGSRRG